MKLADYERSQLQAQVDSRTRAQAGEPWARPGDGKTTTNALVVMALVDVFLDLPCGPNELLAARKIRQWWARMRTQGSDWSQWSTNDLQIMLAVMVSLTELMDTVDDILTRYVAGRKLEGR